MDLSEWSIWVDQAREVLAEVRPWVPESSWDRIDQLLRSCDKPEVSAPIKTMVPKPATPGLRGSSQVTIRDVLHIIVTHMPEEEWRFGEVTASKLVAWTEWKHYYARSQLERLVKQKYAIKSGREARSQRINTRGAPCVTYSLVSDRVAKLLGLKLAEIG